MLSRLIAAEERTPAALGLEPGATQAAQKAWKQLARDVQKRGERPNGLPKIEEALMIAILTGYPDRVARRRRAKRLQNPVRRLSIGRRHRQCDRGFTS
jgi:hypothetical protein